MDGTFGAAGSSEANARRHSGRQLNLARSCQTAEMRGVRCERKWQSNPLLGGERAVRPWGGFWVENGPTPPLRNRCRFAPPLPRRDLHRRQVPSLRCPGIGDETVPDRDSGLRGQKYIPILLEAQTIYLSRWNVRSARVFTGEFRAGTRNGPIQGADSASFKTLPRVPSIFKSSKCAMVGATSRL
jgi:hypothetical protein